MHNCMRAGSHRPDHRGGVPVADARPDRLDHQHVGEQNGGNVDEARRQVRKGVKEFDHKVAALLR